MIPVTLSETNKTLRPSQYSLLLVHSYSLSLSLTNAAPNLAAGGNSSIKGSNFRHVCFVLIFDSNQALIMLGFQ